MVYSVLGAVGPRAGAAPGGLSLGMVDLTCLSEWWISPVCEAVDNTAQVCLAGFCFRNMPHLVGQTPPFPITRRDDMQMKSQTNYCPICFFLYIRIKHQNA